MINVKSNTTKDGWVFTVQVQESTGATEHRVRMSQADYKKLTGNAVSPEECVRKSFELLLERESKESILREFDIMKIAYYFPEYPKELERRIRN
jgi:hypothetical protein